jgi:alanine dehydrogenase
LKIGVPREVKPGERRVAVTPVEAAALTRDGHDVVVERGAGEVIGHADAEYRAAGARSGTLAEAWSADLIVKVKEMQPGEARACHPGQAIFGFHHLVGEPDAVRALAAGGVTAIAFEMVQDASGGFPVLAPMSEIAGRMALRVGARHLGRTPAKVLVIGAGHAGLTAAAEAEARGCEVVLLSRSGTGGARAATPEAIERHALEADLVVGAVFVAGAATPKLLAARARRAHEARRDDRRHLDRRRRHRGDLAADDPRRPRVLRRRRHPLLRRQHAGRGAAGERRRAGRGRASLRARHRRGKAWRGALREPRAARGACCSGRAR